MWFVWQNVLRKTSLKQFRFDFAKHLMPYLPRLGQWRTCTSKNACGTVYDFHEVATHGSTDLN